MMIKPHPEHAAARALPETERYAHLAPFINQTPAKKRWDVMWKLMYDSTGRELHGCYQPMYEACRRYFDKKTIPAETLDLNWKMPRVDSVDIGYLDRLPADKRVGYVLPLLKTFTRDERKQAVKDIGGNTYLPASVTEPILQAVYLKYPALCPPSLESA